MTTQIQPHPHLLLAAILFTAAATSATAQGFAFPLLETPLPENFQARDGTNADYEKGLANLDARRWDAAIANFEEAARQNKSLTDAALYWKAYALTRAGRQNQSLVAVRNLEKFYPNSRWANDAKALSIEIQANTGHPVSPAAETDEDLKLLALNTLMQEDSKSATAALIQIVQGTASDKTKEHALFVLAQSGDPSAREALLTFGRQSSNLPVQLTAVRMMGMMGGEGARKELTSLYTNSSNQALKQEVLNGLMLSGSQSALLTVAKTESDPNLRNSALSNLKVLSASSSTVLVQLYRDEPALKARLAILDSLLAQRNKDALQQLAVAEKDAGLKREILKRLAAIH